MIVQPVKRRLTEDRHGASVVEFALIMPVFAAMILGFLDFGHWALVRSMATGGLEQAARAAGVGGAAVNPRTYELLVEANVRTVASTATFVWDKKSYYQFSGINKPEKLTTDNDGDLQYDAGDCWEDLNPNGTYDISPGRDGVGGADDIVLYKVTVAYPPLIPLGGLLPGVPDTRSVTASGIIKRQPFATQPAPAIRC